jgi:hypothetical protein
MVVRMKTANSVLRAFNYNENKVTAGVATCIMASGYPKDLYELTKGQRVNRLIHQSDLNTTAQKKAIHISLNFHPSEKISQEKLARIAEDYMKSIGFGDHPYLVYEHTDSAHPHIHIVSTTINSTGRRINTQNIVTLKSEPARKALEIKYGLVKAKSGTTKSPLDYNLIDPELISYEKKPTKAAIQNVLAGVLRSYRYTSLSELNALLKLYNINAYEGEPESRTTKNNGLFFRVLNDQNNGAGKAIKSSSFFIDMDKSEASFKNRPTKAFLEHRFKVNYISKKNNQIRLKNLIDLALLNKPKGDPLHQLINTLKADGVDVVVRKNDEGRIYGLTYIDHKSKCIYNGSELDGNGRSKKYSAQGILQRTWEINNIPFSARQIYPASYNYSNDFTSTFSIEDHKLWNDIVDILGRLFSYEYTYQPLPYELRLGRKKRRRKKRNNR